MITMFHVKQKAKMFHVKQKIYNNGGKDLRKTKKALVFASAILVLTLLVGCMPSSVRIEGVEGPDELSKTNDTVNDVDALLSAQQWVDMLEGVDYEGYEFVVATTREKVLLTEEEASSMVDEAKLLRNEMVEKKFNVKIVEKLYELEDLLPEQSTAALVDTAIGDIVCAPSEQLAVLSDNGLLLNLYSVPYLNMDAKYVSEQMKVQYTAENTAFMMFDDAISYQTNLWAVFYNVDLLGELGLEDPYTYLKNGEWTWDLMLEMAKKVLPEPEEVPDDEPEEAAEDDETSEESTEPVKKLYGITTYHNGEEDLDLAYAMLGSMGARYFGDSYQKPMTLSLELEKANKTISSFLDVINSEMHYKGDGMDAITEFSEGNILFYVYETSMAAALANSKTEWSVVPLPKFSPEQENYYSWLDRSAIGIGFFNTNTDSVRAGRILNCILAASFEHIRESIDMAYVNYYLRNNSSAVSMTKYVFNNPFVDPTMLYGSGIEDIRTVTYEKLSDAILKGDDLEKNLYDEENKALAESFFSEMFK